MFFERVFLRSLPRITRAPGNNFLTSRMNLSPGSCSLAPGRTCSSRVTGKRHLPATFQTVRVADTRSAPCDIAFAINRTTWSWCIWCHLCILISSQRFAPLICTQWGRPGRAGNRPGGSGVGASATLWLPVAAPMETPGITHPEHRLGRALPHASNRGFSTIPFFSPPSRKKVASGPYPDATRCQMSHSPLRLLPYRSTRISGNGRYGKGYNPILPKLVGRRGGRKQAIRVRR